MTSFSKRHFASAVTATSQIESYCTENEIANKKGLITSTIDRYLSREPYKVKWLVSTAYCFFYHQTQPFRFSYDAKRALLRYSEHDAAESRITRTLELTHPLLFLGSFNPLNKYIRFVSVQGEMNERRLIKLHYAYECTDKTKGKAADVATNGSRGLLHDISGSLSTIHGSATNINLRYVTSHTKRVSKATEKGEIEIIGTIEAHEKSCTTNLPTDIERAARNCKLPNCSLKVMLSYHTHYKIFLSCREELKGDRTFVGLCKRIESKYGVTFLFSSQYADSVTPDVLGKIDDADAMIVIFSITTSEHAEYIDSKQRTRYRPDLYWLVLECGIAKGKGKPLFQFRDTSVVLGADWEAWIKSDGDAPASCENIFQVGFEDKFDKVVSHIANSLGILEFLDHAG